MSIIAISKFMLLFILLLNPPSNITPLCVDATRPLEENVDKFINLKPKKDNIGGRVFQGRNVEGCLPKGFRRSSAPSRYINYQPLESACSSTNKVVNAP